MTRRSLEEKIGAGVLTLGKLAVVALAIVGALALFQSGLLGGVAGLGTTVDSGTDAAGDALGATNTTTQTQPATATTAAEPKRQRIENTIHAKINDRREERGLQPVAKDENLRQIARSHSEDMAQGNYFSHESRSGETFEGRYDQFGYYCRVQTGNSEYVTGGENIWMIESAGSQPVEEVAERAVSDWMDSDDHRRNILRDYWDDMGIGVYILDNGSETAIYVTQNFC